MRLLMTTDTVGGVWTFTSELTRQLLQRGHAVHLVSFGRKPSAAHQAWASGLVYSCAQGRHPERSEGSLYSARGATTSSISQQTTPAFTYTPSELPLEWMQDNERAFDEGQAVLLKELQHHSADLILSNQFCFGALNTSIPRIVVAHSDVLSWAKACKPSALAPTPWLNRYTSMVQAGLLGTDAAVAPTHWMLNALAENFALPFHHLEGAGLQPRCNASTMTRALAPEGNPHSASTLVIPNGAHPPKAGVSPGKMQVVSAGRLWDEAKGLDILNDCELPCPVFITGDICSPEGAAPRSTPVNVTALGALPRPELHNLFAESALYLCTSRYEPFGLAPLEAALCGCAIVARDIPSLREVWGDAAVYFTDAQSLTAQVQQLVTDQTALKDAQGRAQGRALLYTPERMADSYLALFESVLQSSRAMSHVA